MAISLALKLLLLLESANGTNLNTEAIGGSVGWYHLTPATIRNLDVSLRNMTNKEINKFILKNPSYEKALATLLLEQLSLNLKKQSLNQKVALLSFGYNAGVGAMILIRDRLNKCDNDAHLHYILQYTNAKGKALKGLEIRRFKEASLLNKDKMKYNMNYVEDKSICYKNFNFEISQKIIEIQFRS